MPNATYYKIKYPNMTDEQAAKLADLDNMIVLPDTPMTALCKIDEPDCESCQ